MSLAVSSLAKTYYNIYALTNSDAYKAHAVNSSAVSKAKYNVAGVDSAFDMLSSESNFNTIGSIGGYAKDLYKLSQIKNTGNSHTLTDSVVSLLSKDTDMYSILDTSAANAQTIKEALKSPETSGGSQTSNAISTYNSFVSSYTRYIENNGQDLISVLL